MRRFRRFGWAALASLAIHAALLVLLWDETPPVRPRPTPARPAPVFVEVVTSPRSEPPSAPQPTTQPPPTPPRPAVPLAKPPPVQRTEAAPPTPLDKRTPAAQPPAPDAVASTPGGVTDAVAAAPDATDLQDTSPNSPTGSPHEDRSESLPVAMGVTDAGVTPHNPSPPVAAPVEPEPRHADTPMGLLAGETTPPGPRRPRDHLFPLPSALTPGEDSRPSGLPIQSGRTLRPGDAGPSREALLAEERGRVGERVQGVIDDQRATLRVANGLIDPYFSRLREALEKGLENAPVFPGTSLLDQATTNWASQSKNFGATGNPGGPVPNAPTSSEQLKALQNRSGDRSMEGLRGRVQAGDELQKLAGGGGAKLIVTLELHQDTDGTLRDAKLVTLSGNPAYDAFVLNAVPASLAKLGAPPDGARGVKATGIHTLWSVEGRVVYFRKLKELKGQDSLYVATAVAAGMLAGRFEETTGEIEVIDFRNPRFVCQPRLLRVY